MDTPLRSLAALGRARPASLVVAWAFVVAGLPTLAQRVQGARGPSASPDREVSLGCPLSFVGQQLTLGEQPADAVLVDLDGDGDLDVAAAGRFPGAITTAFNHRGEFVTGASHPLSGDAIRLVAGDVSGDGRPDLVVSLVNTPTPAPIVAVLLNQGRGVLAAPVEYPTSTRIDGAWIPSLALADLDGDGDRDLAVPHDEWTLTPSGDWFVDTSVALLLNQGNGTFGLPSETPLGPPDTVPEWPQESFVLAEDLDGDGDADLAVSVGDQDALYVLQNLGAGTFSVSTPYAIDSQPGALVAADLDGDGDRDLAVVKSQADSFAVLLNQGGGSFASALSYEGGLESTALACADLDGDGDEDLAFTSRAYPLSVCVVRSRGDASFDPPQQLAGHLRPNRLMSGDLDGNGAVDLVSVNGETVALLRNVGGGAFEAAPSHPAGPGPRLVSNADVDGDGDRDLVVGSGTQTRVAVLGNLGGGAFASPVEYTLGSLPLDLTLADLDRDGRLDLVATGGTRAYVRLNQGAGAFGSSVSYAGIGPLPSGATSADLDGDGAPDLAFSLASSNTLAILPGLGDGSLGPVVKYPSGFEASDISGSDLNRDGDVDLVLVSQTTGSVRLFDNQGAGTFTLLASHPAGGDPIAVSSADLDGDGRVDLAVLLEPPTRYDRPHVGTLLNLGGGSFGPSTLHTVGQEALDLLSADLDDDAHIDLVVVANDSRALSLLQNLGNGTFAGHVQVTAGNEPMGVTAGDLDGDGDLDLASTAQASGTVEIHFNRCR